MRLQRKLRLLVMTQNFPRPTGEGQGEGGNYFKIQNHLPAKPKDLKRFFADAENDNLLGHTRPTVITMTIA